MEIVFNNYKIGEKQTNFTIKSRDITGIYGIDKQRLVEITSLRNGYQGKIEIDNKILFKKDINSYRKKIAIISEKFDPYIEQKKVYEAMYYEMRKKEICLKDPSKKVKDALKVVGLNYNYINRDIKRLSSSEKKQLALALALLSNPSIIIIIDPFINYDKITEKKIWLLIQRMREQYNKKIIFVSDDVNMLYKYTDQLFIVKNNKIIAEGRPLDIFKRISFLKKHSIEIPEIIDFTYLAQNKKNAKIDYHKDIRDIIKDIYKHV